MFFLVFSFYLSYAGTTDENQSDKSTSKDGTTTSIANSLISSPNEAKATPSEKNHELQRHFNLTLPPPPPPIEPNKGSINVILTHRTLVSDSICLKKKMQKHKADVE